LRKKLKWQNLKTLSKNYMEYFFNEVIVQKLLPGLGYRKKSKDKKYFFITSGGRCPMPHSNTLLLLTVLLLQAAALPLGPHHQSRIALGAQERIRRD
jgi:hypothetical protein